MTPAGSEQPLGRPRNGLHPRPLLGWMEGGEIFPGMIVVLTKSSMTISDMRSDVCPLRAEEERILGSFTRRLIELAAAAGARGSGTSAIGTLNSMRLPAIALDQRGFVVDANTAAGLVFDHDVKIKSKRLFVRDLEARALLDALLSELINPVKFEFLIAEPIIVQRRDKLPVILRIWPFEGLTQSSGQDVHALVTLNALGPRPGPPAEILARTFQFTAPEARLASVMARGAPLQIAARELEISWQTARNQLKSVFAKTYTHRQSELVALLMQVE
jgi:DNA-binding CsgD family transcriptional regulator